MKKLLLTLAIGLFVFNIHSQTTSPPNDLVICDENSGGFASFDLTVNDVVILNGLNPSDYIITYHETLSDADNGVNAVSSPYFNIVASIQTMYVRVFQISTGNVEINAFNIVVDTICNSQTIVMQDGSFSVCEGLFTDSGDQNGNYANDENFTITLCPDTAQGRVTLDFVSFTTQMISDVLTIYNGDSTSSPIIGSYSGPGSPGLVEADNSSGCLTLNFTTNSTGNTTGWVANINCETLICQDIETSIDSTTPEVNTSNIVVAQVGEDISFNGSAAFMDPITSVSYNWDFGDGNNATGATVNHQYTEEGNFTVTLTAEDDGASGCSNTASVEVVILGNNLVVDQDQFTVEELVQNVLIGNDCSSISNISFSTGTTFSPTEPNGIGYFVYEGNDFPFNEGLLISTGDAATARGPNDLNGSSGSQVWPGDSELNTSLGVNSNNATIIEFDFVPVVDRISFEFLMASEEYDGGSFECNFSDAFAFLLTDSSGNTSNLALIPGTDLPILVTNIHPDNGFCGAANPDFFGGYTAADAPPFAFDGRTVPFTAAADVNIGETYHIKLVIGDDGDAAQDSAVFFKAGSFDVGGICEDIGLIQVNAFNDTNFNDINDQNESSFTNGSFTYEKNNDGIINVVNSSNGSFTIISDNESDFYDITYEINDDFNGCYTQNITSIDNVVASLGNVIIADFPVVDNGTCQDMAVYLINPFAAPRPGFNHENILILENLSGSTITSGSVEFTLDEDLVLNGTTVSGSNLTVTPNATGFTLDFIDLPPGSAAFVNIDLMTPVSVSLGEIVTNSVVYIPTVDDLVSDNNESTLSEIVIGSYDPNDKMEALGPQIVYDDFILTDEWLYYTIRFQNVGTAEAIFVRIEDVLDSQLDESTFQMLRSSHDYVITRTGNALEWFFEDINLPAEQDDAEGSNGYVHFRVKPNPGYAINDVIPNSAAIYFDFNPPIITNTFTSTFTRPLSIDDNEINVFSIYPNPAHSAVTVQLGSNSGEEYELSLFDIQGKRLQTQPINETTELDISSLSAGVYFLKVSNANVSSVKKLIVD